MHIVLARMLLSIKHYTKGPYTLYNPLDSSVTYVKEPVTHKWLPNDTVNPTTGAVVSREKRNVVGIVNFLNRTGMGFTSRNVPLYLFHPLDSGYPPMIISSKVRHEHNMIALVSVEHWNEKWPRAGIVRLLGPVGNTAVEKEALLLRAKIPTTDVMDSVEPMFTNEEWDTVFNIDPDGCEDVDDVICWRVRGDSTEFGIAIADVASWIPEGSALDTYASQAGQTLYSDGVAVAPMLPTVVSGQRASLRCDGVARPVLMLCYTLREGRIVSKAWKRCGVVVDRVFTYDSVTSDLKVCKGVVTLLTSVLGCDVGSDPHVWIERAMVLYNTEVAKLLHTHKKGVLRSHEGRSNHEWTALANATGCRDLEFLGSAAGTYVSANVEGIVSHAGLGLEVYCHASSPLRRYADLVNQRWLHHIVFGGVAPLAVCNPWHLNQRNSMSKAFDRDMWFLTHLKTDAITTVTGYILSVKEESVYSVYVPEWKRKVRGKGDGVFHIGTKVNVRAYTDIKSCSWEHRVVCSLQEWV